MIFARRKGMCIFFMMGDINNLAYSFGYENKEDWERDNY